MLAYRHAFHAGNHADVLKHITLMMLLRHMAAKNKPFRYIDTHSGAGGYSLEGPYAQKKNEYELGVGRLWGQVDLPSAVSDYIGLVRQFNPDGVLRQYPGSPALAQMILRKDDQLRLFEMHPTDHRILSTFMADSSSQATVYRADGFEGLKAQVPPSSRRGLVLMDPSYEVGADYSKIVSSLRDALSRFATGVYMVWYPHIQKLEAVQLPKRLQSLAPKAWLHVRLTVQKSDSQGFGLLGSGVFVINPPHTLHAELQAVLPFLTKALGQFEEASHLLIQHVV